jgi:hypothetical protein
MSLSGGRLEIRMFTLLVTWTYYMDETLKGWGGIEKGRWKERIRSTMEKMRVER